MNIFDEAERARAMVREAQIQAHTRGGTAEHYLECSALIQVLRHYAHAMALSTGRSPPRFRTKNQIAKWMIVDCTPTTH